MWDTTGETDLKTKKLPILVIVPYADVEWLSKGGLTPNDLRAWLEEVARNDANFQKDDWELLFEFSLYLIDIYTNYLLFISVLFYSYPFP